MKKFLNSLPKTSIATFAGAVLTYCQAKGYLGGEEAMLVSQIMLALGITVNVISKR